MKRTHIDTINAEAREATMRLYGAIGEKVDGDLFARELASLDDGQLDAIRIRINSPGRRRVPRHEYRFRNAER